jgi:hypothetical protein
VPSKLLNYCGELLLSFHNECWLELVPGPLLGIDDIDSILTTVHRPIATNDKWRPPMPPGGSVYNV